MNPSQLGQLAAACAAPLEKRAIGARAKFISRLINGTRRPLNKSLAREVGRALGQNKGLVRGEPLEQLVRKTTPGSDEALYRLLRSRYPYSDSLGSAQDIRLLSQDRAKRLSENLQPLYKSPAANKLRANQFEALARQADEIAMSGRHNREVLPSFSRPASNTANAALSNRGDTLYKGFVGSPQIFPGLAGRPAVQAKPGDPIWASAYPEVAEAYGSSQSFNLLPYYLGRTPTSAAKRYGPHGPFTPHRASDNRRLLPILPRHYGGKRIVGAKNWGNWPRYEKVTTYRPDAHGLFPGEVFKPLPSGRGYQRIKGMTEPVPLSLAQRRTLARTGAKNQLRDALTSEPVRWGSGAGLLGGLGYGAYGLYNRATQ